MPFNPDTPRSRDEVLLQAIVSGDSSMMGDPRDREEEFVKAIADKETLPDYSEASNGDVLQIGADGPEWGPPDALPDYSGASAGDALIIGNDGPEWGAVGGVKKRVNNIYTQTSNWGFHCSVIASEHLNDAKFAQYLYSIGATYIAQAYPATGYNPDKNRVIGVYSANGSEIKVVVFDGTYANNVTAPTFEFRSIEI